MPSLSTRQRLLLSATAVTTAAAVVGLGSAASWSDSETTSQPLETGQFALSLDGELVHDATLRIANLAPGDTVTRRLDVRNVGDVDFAGVTMALAGDQGSALLDGTEKGLRVTVHQCDRPWTPDAELQDQQIPRVHGYGCADHSWGPRGDYAYQPDNGDGGGFAYVGEGRGEYVQTGEGSYYYVGYGPSQVEGVSTVVRDGAFDTEPVDLPSGALKAGGQHVSSYDVDHGHSAQTAHLLVTVAMPAGTGAYQDVDDLDSDYRRYGGQSATIAYRFTAVQRDGNEVGTAWQYSGDGVVVDANRRSDQHLPG